MLKNKEEVKSFNEDDTVWFVLIKHAFNGSAGAVEAIDILNGVLISDEHPTGMIVTTTNLLVDNPIEASARRTYNIQFLDDSLDDSIDLKPFGKKAAEQTAPWLKALDDEGLYANELILPEVYRALFEGGQSKK